jgi:hypothetical protein
VSRSRTVTPPDIGKHHARHLQVCTWANRIAASFPDLPMARARVPAASRPTGRFRAGAPGRCPRSGNRDARSAAPIAPFSYRSTAVSTEPQTSSTPAAPPPGGTTVYNVLRPAQKESTDHIVIYGHSSLVYWWPVWLVCFVLAGATYSEGDRSGGVAVSATNVPGLVFVATLLAVAVSSTVILRGMVSVVAIVTLIAVAVALGWFGWWGSVLGFLGELEIRINAAGYLCIGVPLFVAWWS